jgi:hypothetical protein
LIAFGDQGLFLKYEKGLSLVIGHSSFVIGETRKIMKNLFNMSGCQPLSGLPKAFY